MFFCLYMFPCSVCKAKDFYKQPDRFTNPKKRESAASAQTRPVILSPYINVLMHLFIGFYTHPDRQQLQSWVHQIQQNRKHTRLTATVWNDSAQEGQQVHHKLTNKKLFEWDINTHILQVRGLSTEQCMPYEMTPMIHSFLWVCPMEYLLITTLRIQEGFLTLLSTIADHYCITDRFHSFFEEEPHMGVHGRGVHTFGHNTWTLGW